MDALPRPKRKPISPIALIRVYEEMEKELPDSIRRADRMAHLLCKPLEEVLDAARACGIRVEEENPAFHIDLAIDIICELYNLDQVRSVERRVPSVSEYRYATFIDRSGPYPTYRKGPFEAGHIAEPLGMRGNWEIQRVITAALNIGIISNTYTGRQASSSHRSWNAMPKTKRPRVTPGSSPNFTIPGYRLIFEASNGFSYHLVRDEPIFEEDPLESRRFSDGQVSKQGSRGGTDASHELGCRISNISAADRVMLNSRNVAIVTIRQGASHKTTLMEVGQVIDQFVSEQRQSNP